MAVVYATLIVFPSPHGVVFSHWRRLYRVPLRISVPLRGVDCFSLKLICSWSSQRFRPLAGCRSFCKFPEESVENCDEFPSPCGVWVVSTQKIDGAKNRVVSVPLRGVDCFKGNRVEGHGDCISVPLRGAGCFIFAATENGGKNVSVPLRGAGCFLF